MYFVDQSFAKASGKRLSECKARATKRPQRKKLQLSPFRAARLREILASIDPAQGAGRVR
jgi:hypothetical protein